MCKGLLQKQPADYMVMYKGAPLLIEVKEEKRPDKLAKSRLTQLPKMRLFEMAGGAAVFLIYHYEQDVWRVFSPLYVTNNTPSTMDLTVFSTINNLEDVFGIMENHLRR